MPGKERAVRDGGCRPAEAKSRVDVGKGGGSSWPPFYCYFSTAIYLLVKDLFHPLHIHFFICEMLCCMPDLSVSDLRVTGRRCCGSELGLPCQLLAGIVDVALGETPT